MLRKLKCVIGLSISMFFAGLASTTLAQATPANPSAHAELIKTLKHAHRLLVHADHDYKGHRAKAAEEVHKALKELGCHPKKAQLGSTPVAPAVVPSQAVQAGQTRKHEPQATSDAQLREAQQLLQVALTQFNGKHPKATANVEAAIAEINAALAIK